MLKGVAGTVGSRVAPLPLAMLRGPKPLRAFVGHVEPTFDWTLRDPANGQVLMHSITSALYKELYQPDMRTPTGFALRRIFDEAGAFYLGWKGAVAGINSNTPGMRDVALCRKLVALDRQSTVILGDPTVSLPL